MSSRSVSLSGRQSKRGARLNLLKSQPSGPDVPDGGRTTGWKADARTATDRRREGRSAPGLGFDRDEVRATRFVGAPRSPPRPRPRDGPRARRGEHGVPAPSTDVERVAAEHSRSPGSPPGAGARLARAPRQSRQHLTGEELDGS